MRNSIYNYTVLTEGGDDDNHFSGTSHAALNGSDNTICGIAWEALHEITVTCLSTHDGKVSCLACMDDLHNRDLVGKYPGPLPFLIDAVVVDGVVLDEFGGMGSLDDSYEDIFAYGHHEPGRVLNIGRKLSKNKLAEWGELQTTIFAHWLLMDCQDGSPYCMLSWRKEVDSCSHIPLLKVFAQDVTVLRHEAWPLLKDYNHNKEVEYRVRRIKDWYRGSTKLGRPVTPDDLKTEYAPGLTVCGIPKDAEHSTCLEWPTHSFKEAKAQITKWDRDGATKLEIAWGSRVVSKEDLDADAARKAG